MTKYFVDMKKKMQKSEKAPIISFKQKLLQCVQVSKSHTILHQHWFQNDWYAELRKFLSILIKLSTSVARGLFVSHVWNDFWYTITAKMTVVYFTTI